MYSHDFMNECKPESDAAKCAASGFIHTKEWLKDTLPKFLRDSVPRIGYRQANVLFLPGCIYCDLSARMIVEYKAPDIEITQAVFDQITRYNMVLKVDYLVVSNGMQHYCCRMDYERNSYTFLPDIPDYQTL